MKLIAGFVELRLFLQKWRHSVQMQSSETNHLHTQIFHKNKVSWVKDQKVSVHFSRNEN